jgi:ClpP class serine protease
MPNWNEVLEEVKAIQRPDALDVIRRKYLRALHDYSGRNVIAYYSGWLQRPHFEATVINDDDKNGFMTTIHRLDRGKGLDLILHTPGGALAATDSLVDYLHAMFANDIRAIVPQLAMSGGTMIACACKQVIMGLESNLGPIDPQFGGIPADGVLEEVEKAKEEMKKDPSTIPLWQTIFSKYHPTFIGECQKATAWSKEVVAEWLKNNMFLGQEEAGRKAATAVKRLSDHSAHKSHDRHIHLKECRDIGLNVLALENDSHLQDMVLTIHHAYMHTFAGTNAIKIIENHNGVAMVQLAAVSSRQ